MLASFCKWDHIKPCFRGWRPNLETNHITNNLESDTKEIYILQALLSLHNSPYKEKIIDKHFVKKFILSSISKLYCKRTEKTCVQNKYLKVKLLMNSLTFPSMYIPYFCVFSTRLWIKSYFVHWPAKAQFVFNFCSLISGIMVKGIQTTDKGNGS